MIYNFTLDNGIRVILNKIDGVFSVSAGIIVGAGSSLETPAENGISHFIEHMNFKGTTTRSAFQISSEIDNLGAQINAFTTKEFTCYYVKSIGEHFGKAFEVLSDIFVNSVYDATELDRERGVVTEEINMYEDTPDEVCADGLTGVYFGAEMGYGATILGPKQNINAFIKQSIIDYKSKYYTPENTVVSIAGAISVQQAQEVCQKYLGEIKMAKTQQKPLVNQINLCGNFVADKDIEQAHVALAFNSVGFLDDNADAHSIICGALGGGMSSRLFQTIREKMGLCYSTYSFMNSYVSCGNMIVYAGVQQKNYQTACNAIVNELKLLKKEGITNEEFLRTREQMKSSFVMSQESTVSQMMLFGKYLLFSGKVFDISEKLKNINALTLDGINNIIFNTLNIENLSTAVVGNGVKKLEIN